MANVTMLEGLAEGQCQKGRGHGTVSEEAGLRDSVRRGGAARPLHLGSQETLQCDGTQ